MPEQLLWLVNRYNHHWKLGQVWYLELLEQKVYTLQQEEHQNLEIWYWLYWHQQFGVHVEQGRWPIWGGSKYKIYEPITSNITHVKQVLMESCFVLQRVTKILSSLTSCFWKIKPASSKALQGPEKPLQLHSMWNSSCKQGPMSSFLTLTTRRELTKELQRNTAAELPEWEWRLDQTKSSDTMFEQLDETQLLI